MAASIRVATGLLVAGAIVQPILAQDPFDPDVAADEFVVRERTRRAVEEALEIGLQNLDDPDRENEQVLRGLAALEAIGPDAVPYLVNEVDQELQESYFFAARALGRFGTPEAEAALRRSVERTRRSPKGQYALARKAWACFQLGLMGRVDAVELLDDVPPLAGRRSLTGTISYLEATAFVTAPESVPVLLELLERYKDDPQRINDRTRILRALGRIGDPSAVPALVAVTEESYPVLRREATLALETTDSDAARAALLRLLEDADPSVRATAAIALERNRPEGLVAVARAKLPDETLPSIRGVYYALLASEPSPEHLKLLLEQRPTNTKERVQLVSALGALGSPEAVPVLASASHDTESAVALQAMFALAEIGTPEAIEAIVPLLASRNFGIVKTAVGQLGRIGATSTAPLIADRLLRAELSRNVDDGRVRDRIPILAEVLVTMRYTERIDALSEAAAKQTDSKLVSYLDSLLARLAAIRDLGDDVDGWISQLSAADPSMRQLAYEELARIGVPKGLDALVALFPDASVEDREAILRSVVDRDAPQVRALVRGILADGEYDDVDSRRTRDLAAWVARQLGGDELIEALRQEIERRHAQDSRVLIYYGLAAGPAALPTFAKHRIARWRYHQVYSGEQQRTLDRLARNLRRGTSTDWIDVRPDWIDYNRFK